MDGVGRRYDGRVLGMIRRLDQIAVLPRDNPLATAARDGEMRDVDARRPVLRLDEQRLSECRAAHFLVRMPVEEEIDAGYLARNPLGDVLTRNPGRRSIVAGRLVEA